MRLWGNFILVLMLLLLLNKDLFAFINNLVEREKLMKENNK